MGKRVITAGGGIIGLCCAYYLNREGHEVTVIDREDISKGASFVNAGYVSPSHFIPLASPYILGKALRWMLVSSSPFYIRPRLDKDLIRWCIAFGRSATKKQMQASVPPLYQLLQLSRELMTVMRDDLGNHFRMEEKGCFMLYKNAATERQELKLLAGANALGLDAHAYNGREIQELEPAVECNVLGGVLYPIDCHLHPGELMETLKARLVADGVKFQLDTSVTGFRKQGNRIVSVLAGAEELSCDELILAGGAWLPELTRMLNIPLLLQPGKGYSMTYPNVQNNLSRPAILIERRIAVTPMGKDLRLGGTMELSGFNDRIRSNRVRAIYDGTKSYFPGLTVPPPEIASVRTGLRPLSPDGLPYIGRAGGFTNLTIAGGHAMLGLSLAAATGLVVADLVSGKTSRISLQPFDPERFRQV